MSKAWDKALPDIEIWKECLRVLKAGAFMVVMSIPRSDCLSRMIIKIEDAGFKVDFTPIFWAYASGFPKACNIGKMVDKRNGNERKIIKEKYTGKDFSDEELVKQGSMMQSKRTERRKPLYETKGNSKLEGSYGGFQPKPAVEVCIVAMKPLSEKTYVDQAMKNGKGITWLDRCRIPYESEGDKWSREEQYTDSAEGYKRKNSSMYNNKTKAEGNISGRFPANLLVSNNSVDTGEIRKSGEMDSIKKGDANVYGKYNSTRTQSAGDTGDFSRYFNLDACQFIITPKASKGEKNKGCEGKEPQKTNDGRRIDADNAFQRGSTLRNNHHPTVKPVKLMAYLIEMFSQKGDVVLDCFMGSGTTGVAAKRRGRRFIGIDREREYVDISNARIDAETEDIEQGNLFEEEAT